MAFLAELYRRDVPDSPSSASADDLYLVGPGSIASQAPGTLSYQFAEQDTFFSNTDDPVHVQAQGKDTPSLVSIFADRYVYLRITNQGAHDATFSVVIGSESMS